MIWLNNPAIYCLFDKVLSNQFDRRKIKNIFINYETKLISVTAFFMFCINPVRITYWHFTYEKCVCMIHFLRTENSPKNTLALGQQHKSLFISLFFLCCEILVMCFMQINTPHKFFPEWQMAPLQGIPWNPYISWKST